jgi:hypothetical protein
MRTAPFVSIAAALWLASCGGGSDNTGGQGGARGGLGGTLGGLGGVLGTGGGMPPSDGSMRGGGGSAVDTTFAGAGGRGTTTGGAGASLDGGIATGSGGVPTDGGAGTTGHPADGAGAADANLHGGASLWIPFDNPATSSTYYFDRCWWFTAANGYCVLLKNRTSPAGSKTSDLLQTTDGGLTFSLLATIDGGNTAFDGDMEVYVFSPTEIWYTTAFVGTGYSGSIGRSTDGGKTFLSLSSIVQTALADPGASPVPNFPLWHLVKVNGRLWVGSYSSYLASSADGGATWQRVAGPLELGPVSAPELIATRTNLLLRYTRGFMIDLYRWDGTTFVEAALPPPSGADHGDTWWRSASYGDGVVFVDQRQYGWWGWPFAVNATLDGGKTFQTILSGQSQSTSDVVGLRDALVVHGSLAYVCGVFAGADQNRYSEIRKSIDGGLTWSVVHSEPLDNTYTSVVLDPTGRAHAMRHVTDAYANLYNYTGHYLLP